MEDNDTEIQGRIHSFESFGTIDGPGIRFIVFFQGCGLHCKYCHNRDTWDTNGGELCSINQIIKKALRCKTYINSSNGGVTISGGEPLMQQDFLLELLKELKKNNLHVAIDTSGSFPITDKVKEILEYTDLVLLDIKHIDDEKCKELTGFTNKFTLEFAKYLNEIDKPVWIRQVIVPGYTDDDNDLLKLKEFLNQFTNIKKVEVLPYHTLGKFKWDELNEKYELEGVEPPTSESINHIKEILDIKEQ